MDSADQPAQPSPGCLVDHGWDDRVATLYTMFPGRIPGRVVRIDRTRYLVVTPDKRVDAHGDPTDEGSEPGPAATGDWVALSVSSDRRTALCAILPRRSAIKRLDPSAPGARPEEQVLVANLDLVFVVHALDRPAQLPRLERTLVMAWESGATPVVVLSKVDLVEGGPTGVRLAEARRAVREAAPGVDTIILSNVTRWGVDQALDRMAPGVTVALIGESGSGKSTLINSLLKQDSQTTGATREGDGKGRHTTTSRELIPIPGHGVVIDTPGLRAVGLWGSREGLAYAFPDIDQLAAGCRFSDCRHVTEPGCSVRAALDEGRLEARRIASYRKMEREAAHQERQLSKRRQRTDQRAADRRYRRVRKSTVEW